MQHNNFLTLVIRWTIVLALGVLLISMATGQSGIYNYVKLQDNKKQLQELITDLAMENESLKDQIEKMQHSQSYQKHFMKSQFGYVEPGEFIYRFDNKNTATNRSSDNAVVNKSNCGGPETKHTDVRRMPATCKSYSGF